MLNLFKYLYVVINYCFYRDLNEIRDGGHFFYRLIYAFCFIFQNYFQKIVLYILYFLLFLFNLSDIFNKMFFFIMIFMNLSLLSK